MVGARLPAMTRILGFPFFTLLGKMTMAMDNPKTPPAHDTVRNVARDTIKGVADSAASSMRDAGSHYVAEPAKDLLSLMRDYAKEKPDVAAMWAFGLGIMIGWKLRG